LLAGQFQRQIDSCRCLAGVEVTNERLASIFETGTLFEIHGENHAHEIELDYRFESLDRNVPDTRHYGGPASAR
jgi:hypothetical protein